MKSEKGRAGVKEREVARISKANVMLWRNFTLLSAAIILVLALVSYFLLGGAFYSQTKKRVNDIGEEIYSVVSDGALGAAEKEQTVNDYIVSRGVSVFVFDEEGNAVLPHFLALPESWGEIVRSARENSGDWQEGKRAQFNLGEEASATYNFVACVDYGGRECRLLVRYPLSHLSGSVHRMQLYVLVIAAAAIIFTFFVSYLMANKLSQPLRDMSNTAKKLAGGDYSVEFTSTQYSEIADLSTALNYMKDEMKKSGDFQKELLANVSHDLKTPLTMIKAYASMVREISGDDPEKRNKHLQVIIDESDRLTGLVDDVLSASKINSGLSQLNKKVFNITEYLYGVINKFDYLTETQGYNIMVDVDPNLYTFADEEKIGQVFYNLISNAVNYTGEDKSVYISLKYSAEDNRIKFAVRDTGKGISEEELAHIWDRYYRSKDTHTRPIKGTGLGLNIVKAILQSHSFEFGVKSEEGYGSTFYVDLPAVDGVR